VNQESGRPTQIGAPPALQTETSTGHPGAGTGGVVQRIGTRNALIGGAAVLVLLVVVLVVASSASGNKAAPVTPPPALSQGTPSDILPGTIPPSTTVVAPASIEVTTSGLSSLATAANVSCTGTSPVAVSGTLDGAGSGQRGLKTSAVVLDPAGREVGYATGPQLTVRQGQAQHFSFTVPVQGVAAVCRVYWSS